MLKGEMSTYDECISRESMEEGKEYSKPYNESIFDFPICNHSKGIGEENIGYTQGILQDGTPFEAELCRTNIETILQVILPIRVEFHEEEALNRMKEKEKEMTKEDSVLLPQIKSEDYTILAIGMVDKGYSEDSSVIKYVEYLAKNSIVHFTGEYLNGGLHYLVDLAGNDLVGVLIGLERAGKTVAKTELTFRPFMKREEKPYLKLVK